MFDILLTHENPLKFPFSLTEVSNNKEILPDELNEKLPKCCESRIISAEVVLTRDSDRKSSKHFKISQKSQKSQKNSKTHRDSENQQHLKRHSKHDGNKDHEDSPEYLAWLDGNFKLNQIQNVFHQPSFITTKKSKIYVGTSNGYVNVHKKHDLKPLKSWKVGRKNWHNYGKTTSHFDEVTGIEFLGININNAEDFCSDRADIMFVANTRGRIKIFEENLGIYLDSIRCHGNEPILSLQLKIGEKQDTNSQILQKTEDFDASQPNTFLKSSVSLLLACSRSSANVYQITASIFTNSKLLRHGGSGFVEKVGQLMLKLEVQHVNCVDHKCFGMDRKIVFGNMFDYEKILTASFAENEFCTFQVWKRVENSWNLDVQVMEGKFERILFLGVYDFYVISCGEQKVRFYDSVNKMMVQEVETRGIIQSISVANEFLITTFVRENVTILSVYDLSELPRTGEVRLVKSLEIDVLVGEFKVDKFLVVHDENAVYLASFGENKLKKLVLTRK